MTPATKHFKINDDQTKPLLTKHFLRSNFRLITRKKYWDKTTRLSNSFTESHIRKSMQLRFKKAPKPFTLFKRAEAETTLSCFIKLREKGKFKNLSQRLEADKTDAIHCFEN